MSARADAQYQQDINHLEKIHSIADDSQGTIELCKSRSIASAQHSCSSRPGIRRGRLYSPAFNAIEQAFSTPKAYLHKAYELTIHDPWNVSPILDLAPLARSTSLHADFFSDRIVWQPAALNVASWMPKS